MKTNNKKITNIILVGLIGIIIGINIPLFSSSNIIASRDDVASSKEISVCFTPHQGAHR